MLAAVLLPAAGVSCRPMLHDAQFRALVAACGGVVSDCGRGAGCTTRGGTGRGVPKGTATADAAAARDCYYARSGKFVPIITEGGMTTGGDICKALACGADGVIV